MSDETVVVEGLASDDATLLLAAAEELGLPADVVRTSEDGFVVPKAVHDKAYGKRKTSESSSGAGSAKKAPAKKAPAKKAAAKKAGR